MSALGRYLAAFFNGAIIGFAKSAGAVLGVCGAIWLVGLWPEFVALLGATIEALEAPTTEPK